MALNIVHSTVATFPDEPGAEINKAEWNAAHTITGTLNQSQNNVAVDGVTITGDGTPGNPLIAATGGSGDVTGPGSATDGHFAVFNGATGKIIKDGGAATTASVPDSANRRYVTDAQLVVIGNTSGTNTGDQTNITGNAGTLTVANEAADTTCFIGFWTAASGSLPGKTNTNMTFDSSTGIATFASTVLTTTDINGGTVDGTVIGGSSAAAATVTTLGAGVTTITSNSAASLSVGPNGATNPVLKVDSSTASQADGALITGAAAGTGPTISPISSGSNSPMTINTLGTSSLNLATAGTGSILIRPNGSTRVTFAPERSVFAPTTNSTAATVRFSYASAADTSLTGGTEAPSAYFNLGTTRQHASNTAITLQRDFRITGSTHSFVSATGTVTDLAALSIDGYAQAGTNAIATNAHGLYIPTQAVAGTVTNAYGITVAAPTGAATNNYAINATNILLGNTGLTIGASLPFSDSAGTLTLQNVDAIDATTENTIEAAIDTLANLTSIQGQSFTVSGATTVSGTNTGDQFLFKTISVSGQSDIVADTTADTLTIAAGSNVTLTTNASTDTLTIAASGSGISLGLATQIAIGAY